MTQIAEWLTSAIRLVPTWAVYLICCGVAYIETATLIAGWIMPTEAVLLAAGVTAGLGTANITALIIVTVLASMGGDGTGYLVGRCFGPRLTDSVGGRWMGEGRWAEATRKIDDNGMVATVAGRWVAYVRTVMPRVAGMSRMAPRRFLVADALGVVSYVSAVLLLGYFAGAALGATILLYAAGVSVGLVVCWFAVRWWRRRRAG
ncbi:MAG: DedA family protein [Gordonia sp. (in: high G+C Gram-positive bacteria)]